MTCWQCGLHENGEEHRRDIRERSARISEGFCAFCSERLEVRTVGCGWHCGFYQRATPDGYEVGTYALDFAR